METQPPQATEYSNQGVQDITQPQRSRSPVPGNARRPSPRRKSPHSRSPVPGDGARRKSPRQHSPRRSSRSRSPTHGRSARSRSPSRQEENDATLYVCGFVPHVREPDVVSLFDKYADIISIKVVQDPHTGDSRGFGFVRLASLAGAEDAIRTLHGTTWMGRTLTVQLSKRKSARPPTPGIYLGTPRYNTAHDDPDYRYSRGYSRYPDYRRRDERRYYDRGYRRDYAPQYERERDMYRRDFAPYPPMRRSPPRYDDMRRRSPPPYNEPYFREQHHFDEFRGPGPRY